MQLTHGRYSVASRSTRSLAVMRIIAVVLTALMAPLGQAYAADADPPGVLSSNQWPTTVDDVVRDLHQKVSEADKTRIRAMPKSELIGLHHGFGTWIRNYYGLWRGNEALKLSACGKRCVADDASMVIIERFWAALQK